jgi:putative radical SAM enzyme (TIGR03279 family)
MSVQPATIAHVLPDSIAAEVGFEIGDRIITINGQAPRDLIDYQFLCADEVLALEVCDRKGATHHVEIEKDYDEDLGLEFTAALFDNLIQCNNHCPFCFIDQQPPGKRESLYLKDDDYRLSFLYGSYLTLTNLTEREWQRIAQMRLSPLYVSVHATEPEVRIRLLKNPRAGLLLDHLKWFQTQRLQIHAQVVVCPGINDGIHLERTLLDLASFHQGEIPTVASIAVVPVGLTRFRPMEDELVAVNPEKAREVMAQVQRLQAQFQAELGSTVAWLADEWFLIGGQPLPQRSHYEDYPQIGNGVGSIRQFLMEFEAAAQNLPASIAVGDCAHAAPRTYVWIVGLTVRLVALNSQYWGQEITVTGLLTGQDILHGLTGQDLGDGILLPRVMLKHDEAKFLDDMTVAELERQLGTTIYLVDGIDGLIEACLEG